MATKKLNSKDWEKWSKKTLVFISPALLAVLIALQGFLTNGNHFPTQVQIVFALGAGYSALLASLIGFLDKYKNGK